MADEESYIVPPVIHMPTHEGTIEPHRIATSSIVHVMSLEGQPHRIVFASMQSGHPIGMAAIIEQDQIDEIIGTLQFAKVNCERMNAGLAPLSDQDPDAMIQ